jgi:hypothetical protein
VPNSGFPAHIAQGFAPIGTCQLVRVVCEASEFEAQFALCEKANNERFFGPVRRAAKKFSQGLKLSQRKLTHSSVLTGNRGRVQRTATWWYSSDDTRFNLTLVFSRSELSLSLQGSTGLRIDHKSWWSPDSYVRQSAARSRWCRPNSCIR